MQPPLAEQPQLPHVRWSLMPVPTVEALGHVLGHVAFAGTIMHALNDGTGVMGKHALPVPHPPPPLGSWLLQIRPFVGLRVGRVDFALQLVPAESEGVFAAT